MSYSTTTLTEDDGIGSPFTYEVVTFDNMANDLGGLRTLGFGALGAHSGLIQSAAGGGAAAMNGLEDAFVGGAAGS